MSNRFWQKPRRITAGIVAGAIASMAALAASPAGAIVSDNYPPNGDGDRIVRVYGLDRYETAVAMAQQGGFNACSGAVFASGENFPDALTGGPLAAQINVPIILVPKSGALPPSVDTYLTSSCATASGPVQNYILGGTNAVGADVALAITAKLAALGRPAPTRIAGADRYETASLIAQTLRSTYGVVAGNAPDLAKLLAGTTTATSTTVYRTAIIATGENFPDALGAGGLAAGGYDRNSKHPIILSTSTGLPLTSIQALYAHSVQQVILLGGASALSSSVETQLTGLGIKVVRIGGVDRFATAAALNGTLAGIGQNAANGPIGLDPRNVNIANFVNFPDALAAAPFLGRYHKPIFGVTTSAVPTTTASALQKLACPSSLDTTAPCAPSQTLWVNGGPNAVADTTAITALSFLGATTANAPKLLSATGAVSNVTVASVVLNSAGATLGITVNSTSSQAGVAGNAWTAEINGINNATPTVTVDTTAKTVKITVDPLAPTTGASLAALLAANATFAANFTASIAGGPFGTSVPAASFTGGLSEAVIRTTWDQAVTPLSGLITWQAGPAFLAAPPSAIAVDSTNNKVIITRYAVTSASVPLPGPSNALDVVIALAGAVQNAGATPNALANALVS